MAGFIITGSSSGVGKTTVVTALLSLLGKVLPYKIGPDFIDPKFHEFITKEQSINLDAYIYDKDILNYLFNYRNKEGYIKVVEGVMGLYGGIGHQLDNCSTAHMSRILDLPVILVVDGKGKDTTIAAEILGLCKLDERVNIQGVIINRVSEKSYLYIKDAIETHTNVRCLGYLPYMEEIVIDERHLGLRQASEIDDLGTRLELLKSTAGQTIDLDAIREIANSTVNNNDIISLEHLNNIHLGKSVAVAKDEAFTFMYNVHIELFEKMGVEVKYFSPLHDSFVPESDLIFLPGGYPELYLEELYANKTLIADLKAKIESGVKVLAECGGFIYLTKGMYKDDKFYPLCAVYDITIQMNKSLDFKRFGYITIDHKGTVVRGHEFHFSSIKDCNEVNTAYHITNKNYYCGYEYKNVIAGYPHILYLSNIDALIGLFK